MNEMSLWNPMGAQLSVNASGFRFFLDVEHPTVSGLEFGVVVDDQPQTLRYSEILPAHGGMDARGRLGTSALRGQTLLRLVPGINAITVHHTLINTGERPVRLRALATQQWDGSAGIRLGHEHAPDLRYCHSDNVRPQRYPTFQEQFPYVRPLPAYPLHLGRDPVEQFPAVYFTEKAYSRGLVIAEVGQETSYHSFEFNKGPFPRGSMFETFRLHHNLYPAGERLLAPTERLTLDGTYYQLTSGVHPQDAFTDYLVYLATHWPMRGARTPLRTEAYYCGHSPTDGASNEQALLKVARFVRAQFPHLTHFLLDAGESVPATPERPAVITLGMDGCYPDPNGLSDAGKFPHGIEYFLDRLRQLGFKPGIRWSPIVRLDSLLAREHPEWLVHEPAGTIWPIAPAYGLLDYAQPAAMAFIDQVLRIIVKAWGIHIIRLDLWQGPSPDAMSLHPLLAGLRAHLGDDGVLLLGQSAGMSNPCLGEAVDSGVELVASDSGFWEEFVADCLGRLPTLGVPGHYSLLTSSAGFTFNLVAPEHENFFRLTWQFIIMGAQAVAGQLDELPERYLSALQKLIARTERGFRCQCADEHAFTSEPLPEILFVDYPEDSDTFAQGIRQSIAIFNWDAEPKVISWRREKLGQKGPVQVINFWTGEEELFWDEFIVKRLEGHTALLYDAMVREYVEPRIR
jgi:hypothetical protein